jgi:hypothetical protein
VKATREPGRLGGVAGHDRTGADVRANGFSRVARRLQRVGQTVGDRLDSGDDIVMLAITAHRSE